jgi:hypothetical protein
MWLIPTRNRPDAMRALIHAMAQAGDVPECAVMVDHDEDGLHLYDDVPWPKHWHVHYSLDHFELTAAINRLVGLYPGRSFYGLLADHARPRTKGWSEIMEKEAGSWNIAYCEDGWLNGRRQSQPWRPHLSGAVCVGGKLIETLGWLFLPETVHLYVDDALEELGDRLGLLRYRPDVLVEADRPETTGRLRDDNHQRTHRGKPFAEADRLAFEAWRNGEGFARTVEKVATTARISPLDTPVVFACVKTGTSYGPEWVNILVDMIRRHLPENYRARFVCLTDDPDGLNPAVEVCFTDLEGWWAKLQMFAVVPFPINSRVIYLDLDSLVVNEIDVLLSYRGPLALLRDFYRPDGLGSGVMLWRASEAEDIWTKWIAAGCPRPSGGDQAWIETVRPDALRLQDIFPEAFVSYKEDCHRGLPGGAKVVSFHGEPKCDTALDDWVRDFWKVGGSEGVMLNLACNTSDQTMLANVRKTMAREDIHFLRLARAHDRPVMICGSGPSLKDTYLSVAAMVRDGADILALNGAGRFLYDAYGLISTWQVVLDSRPENVRFIGPWAAEFLISSTCDPAILDAATELRSTTVFHPEIPGIENLLGDDPQELIGGGITVGLTAMAVAYTMGYRDIHLYGYDSSCRDDATHAFEQERTSAEARKIEVTCAGRTFVTTRRCSSRRNPIRHSPKPSPTSTAR